MADGLGFQPRIGEPESAMTPGMAAPREPSTTWPPPLVMPRAMPDTSIGYVAEQQPARWVYDFDPANGLSRASFNGEVNFPGVTPGLVTSFNARTGAVTLTTADITGAGGASAAGVAAGYAPLSAFQPNGQNYQALPSPGLAHPNFMQWGQVSYNAVANSWQVFNFLQAFPNACVAIIGCCASGGVYGNLIIGQLSATQFQVNSSVTGINVYFIAFGN